MTMYCDHHDDDLLFLFRSFCCFLFSKNRNRDRDRVCTVLYCTVRVQYRVQYRVQVSTVQGTVQGTVTVLFDCLTV